MSIRLLAGVAGLTLATLVAMSQVATPTRYWDMGAVGPERTADELWQLADVVVLVQATGQRNEHWTSRDNKRWTAPENSGITPLIVRDETVRVVKAWKGDLASARLTVRTIGGTADGVHLDFDGMKPFRTNGTYLLYLQSVDWPTRDGLDRGVLTPVGHGQGIFRETNGQFANGARLVSTADRIHASVGRPDIR